MSLPTTTIVAQQAVARRRRRGPYRGYPQGISGAAAEARKTRPQKPAGWGSPQEWMNAWTTANPGKRPPWEQAKPASPTGGIDQTKQSSPSSAPPTPTQSGGEIMDSADARHRWESGLHDIDSAAERARIETEYQKTQIEKGRVAGRDAAQWDAAARGLHRSSIRDGTLYDIDATAALRKDFLQKQLDSTILEGQRQRQALNSWWSQWQSGMNQQMAERAMNEPVAAQTPPSGPQGGMPGAAQLAALGGTLNIHGGKKKRYVTRADGKKYNLDGTPYTGSA